MCALEAEQEGEDPEDYCERQYYIEAVEEDATFKDDKGQSALDIAVSSGRRLTGFWDENEELKNRFGEAIEILGGSRESLNPQETP